ncbi:extracellular solute-binding protein [Paenibacillus thiaminolyticus]|uniref:ABC transporter substrate-binding protein n=1 Tax=Paenibacillus thiaminolyticus TaxID=49283 RepID=UPI003D268BF7
MISWRRYTIFLFTALLLLAGCSGEKAILPDMTKDGKGVVKVMYFHEQSFHQKYGDLFAIKYPDIEIEVVGMDLLRDYSKEEKPGERLNQFIEKENPDLILVDAEQLTALAEKGKLLPLDAVLKQERFNTAGIPSLTMDFFRQLGGGHIYALSPTYNVEAIYYNADLFREHGIEPPRNQMTWEELFELASRFGQLGTEEKPLYGLSTLFSNPMSILMNVTQTKELRMIDSQGEKMQFDSDGWKEAYRVVSDAITTNGLYMPDAKVTSISMNETPFVRKQSAMMINSPTSSKALQGNSTFEVGIVTMPVNPANPGVSPFMSFNEMFAINSNSANKRIAWELLSYMCSPEMAKTLVSGYSLSLPIRNEGIAEIGGLPAEPFTMLKPYAEGGPSRNVLERVKASPEFNAQIYQTMSQTLISIVKDDKPVEEALAAMQKELQERLELEKKK